MTTLLEATSADYVAQWPRLVARRYGLAPSYVAEAITTVTGQPVDPFDKAFYDGGVPHPAVAALDMEAATAVMLEVEAIKARLAEHRRTHCEGCGLPFEEGGWCYQCQ